MTAFRHSPRAPRGRADPPCCKGRRDSLDCRHADSRLALAPARLDARRPSDARASSWVTRVPSQPDADASVRPASAGKAGSTGGRLPVCILIFHVEGCSLPRPANRSPRGHSSVLLVNRFAQQVLVAPVPWTGKIPATPAVVRLPREGGGHCQQDHGQQLLWFAGVCINVEHVVCVT